SIDFDNRQILTDRGPVEYDYLILAIGSVPAFYGIPSIERQAHALKELNDAVALRNHILVAFERASTEPDPQVRKALMTFVVVGAGPTGVEFAGSLAVLVYHALRRDYPGLRVEESRVALIEASDQILSSFPQPLQRYAHRRLKHLGVEVMLNTPVVGAETGRVLFENGSEIASHTLFWAAGVQAGPLIDALPISKTRSRRIPVTPELTLEGHPEVFAVGDIAHVEQDGEPLLMVAPVALQEGEYVAETVLARERGEPVAPFRYHSRGNMAIIGRYAAVADAYGVHLRGLTAWAVWLGLHLYYLIGFRNRLMALLNWAYDYLLVDPKLRLITQELEHFSHQPKSEDG
ncbi:MAG: pyridine nucleotide-disulfide oxidoreductase, partial [Chloroflexi bacterium RBG_13_56_8]